MKHLVFVIHFVSVVKHSLDASHSLDKLSSIWAWPTYSINCLVNGTEAHPLHKMPSVWAGPFSQQFIEEVGLAHTLDGLLSEWGRHVCLSVH